MLMNRIRSRVSEASHHRCHVITAIRQSDRLNNAPAINIAPLLYIETVLKKVVQFRLAITVDLNLVAVNSEPC